MLASDMGFFLQIKREGGFIIIFPLQMWANLDYAFVQLHCFHNCRLLCWKYWCKNMTVSKSLNTEVWIGSALATSRRAEIWGGGCDVFCGIPSLPENQRVSGVLSLFSSSFFKKTWSDITPLLFFCHSSEWQQAGRVQTLIPGMELEAQPWSSTEESLQKNRCSITEVRFPPYCCLNKLMTLSRFSLLHFCCLFSGQMANLLDLLKVLTIHSLIQYHCF